MVHLYKNLGLYSRIFGKKGSRVRKRFVACKAVRGRSRSKSASPADIKANHNVGAFGLQSKSSSYIKDLTVGYIGITLKPTQKDLDAVKPNEVLVKNSTIESDKIIEKDKLMSRLQALFNPSTAISPPSSSSTRESQVENKS